MAHKKDREKLLFKKRSRRELSRRFHAQRIKAHKARFEKPSENPRRKRKSQKKVNTLQTRFPPVLDFSSNTETTLKFFAALKEIIFVNPVPHVLVDPDNLTYISADAALVLIAELSRASSVTDCNIMAKDAQDPEVNAVLGEIGFFEYVGGLPWKPSNRSRKFMVHKRHRKVVGPIAKEIIERFTQTADLTPAESKALYAALLECMTNVLQHAYPPEFVQTTKVLPKQWWLLGSYDDSKKEISFVFFDQGIGIPRTIRTRLADRVPALKSDAEILIEAVEKGQYSKTKDPTRGKGLPALKAFIDTHTNGELAIVTHHTKCIFKKGQAPEHVSLETPIGGTLIIWTLQA
jgi:hypothetical protein